MILSLAAATFTVRLSGYLLGRRLPDHGPWARGLQALPGCLILSLVTCLLMQGGPLEWVSGAVAFAVALATRSLPLTMAAGIAAICLLRAYF
ncbi:branched-chain amino acid ABC transporter [Leisingera methylohalidivorans DSM 14336]|uniref:Branched-chain amino acid ABC transporter n=1 Tax=Leisingera methylohalidivorans DSM 14336 TaxID=999552 RepID=V9VPS5_9RHOB|nr:branched-chain amino acid ABC transporter [Leisingera methylohalidivorans DSM 14336]